MNIITNNLNYGEIVTQIKQWVVSNNINNQNIIEELNVEGSNISTIIDIIAYVFMVSNLKNEIYFNEFSLNEAVLPSNRIKRAMDVGYLPASKKSSSIKLNLTSKLNPVTTSSSGYIVAYPISNPDIQFLCDVPNSTTFTSSQPIEFEFKQIVKQATLSFNINTNILSNASYIEIPQKFDIDYNTFKIYDTNGEEFIRFDNTINMASIDRNKNYYIMDFSGDNLVIRFLGGFIGKSNDTNLTIYVDYNLTFGSFGNGYRDNNFKIKSSNITGITDNIKISPKNNISSNGIDEVDTAFLKHLAVTSFKSQKSIIIKDDLYWYLKSKYSGYEIVIKTSEELFEGVTPGIIYVSMYRILNNKIFMFDYANENWEELYSKISLGSKINFIDIEEVNVRINSSVVIKRGLNQSLVNNAIQNVILNNFTNKVGFSKYEIQEKVLVEGISGIISYIVDDISFFISRDVSDYNYMKKTFKMNSYVKPPLTQLESLIKNAILKYKVMDNSNADKSQELIDSIISKFNNISDNALLYKSEEDFKIIPIPLVLTNNDLKNIIFRPLSKQLNNITFKFQVEVTSNNSGLLPITNVYKNSNMFNTIISDLNDDTFNISIFNPIMRFFEFNGVENAYCIDENININLVLQNSSILNINFLSFLDSMIDKKIVGFFTDENIYHQNKGYLILNNKTISQNFPSNEGGEITVSIKNITLEIKSDLHISNSDVVLFNRDDIKNSFNII